MSWIDNINSIYERSNWEFKLWSECESEWMNEQACKWIDCLREKILKDGQISLRSKRTIFDQEGSSGTK